MRPPLHPTLGWVRLPLCRGRHAHARRQFEGQQPAQQRERERGQRKAVGESVILLHPPLPLLGVSMWMERERQKNDSLANG